MTIAATLLAQVNALGGLTPRLHKHLRMAIARDLEAGKLTADEADAARRDLEQLSQAQTGASVVEARSEG